MPKPLKPSPRTAKQLDARIQELYPGATKSPGNIIIYEDEPGAFYCWTGVVWLRNEGSQDGVKIK